ncbi:Protein of unknown function [Gryllus bimaculatus]|nr:Protein of unknown function [Gryllus bimaculatus]
MLSSENGTLSASLTCGSHLPSSGDSGNADFHLAILYICVISGCPQYGPKVCNDGNEDSSKQNIEKL